MKSKPFAITVLSIAVLILSILSILCGAEKITLKSLLEGEDISCIILLQLRLPRTLLAILCGAMLGSAGAISQLYFRNPIADPAILGLSSGATLGAVIAIFIREAFSYSIPYFTVNTASFIGAVITSLILAAMTRGKYTAGSALLLYGTALGTFMAAITSALLLTKENALHTMYVWTLGSMSGRGWEEVRFIALPALLAVILESKCALSLDLMAGGEEAAYSLGADVRYLSLLVLFSLSLAASTAVCAGGTIGFIGLICPHIVRRIFSKNALFLLPASALTGSALLTASDILARLIVRPAELPVGIITSFIGAPFFFYIMSRSARQKDL